MQFLFQPLVYGFLLVLVPLLVHLINLLRHRKQPWAAMDFLLESYRRHRRWVMLKQWLLLLARMAIMAVLVAMLAQWVSSARWLSLLGQRVTHHYVLLDDSLSMADGAQGELVYQAGIKAINSLVEQVAQDDSEHQLTVMRWSRASLTKNGEGTPGQADAVADLLERTIPTSPTGLLDRLNTTKPVGLELSPDGAIDMIRPLVESHRGEQTFVYLVSDFRKPQWERPETIRNSLQGLSAAGAEIQLIDCVRAPHENLAIVSLQPEKEVWAACVPLFVQVQVRNFGTQVARNLNLKPRTIEYAATDVKPTPDKLFSGVVQDLPPVIIDQVGPGETVSRRFQVLFPTVGQHVIEVALPDDNLAADNRRACILPLVEGQPVLLIDGDIEGRNALFVESALNPGSTTRTGLKIETKNDAFLRDADPEELQNYAVIVLLDIKRMDEQSITKLKAYVEAGGGLAFFCGDNVDPTFYTERLYAEGKGIFPLPLVGTKQLPPAAPDSDLADIEALNHPVFLPLMSSADSPFRMVRVSQYSAFDSEADPANDKSVQVIAKLRNGQPFIVDKAIGQGRVISIQANLKSTWTTWAQDPSFVVFALRTVGYLASFKQPEVSETIGTELVMSLSTRKFLPQIDFLLQAPDNKSRIQWTQPLTAKGSEEVASLKLRVDPSALPEEVLNGLLEPGTIEVWKTDLQGNKSVSNLAQVSPAVEGDLSKSEPSALISALRPINVRHRFADTVANARYTAGLMNRQTLMMALLLALLAIEQALAYSASFHPPRRQGVFR